MKLKKSLLKAIVIGVTVGSVASCSIIEEVTPSDRVEETVEEGKNDHVCDDDCTESCTESTEGHTWDNCPACGMG